jgi:ubiquinol-cytochrome c reductase cytochrome b subunit
MLPRLFVLHVYLMPAAIALAIAAHLAMVWRQKHTQFPGPGRTESNVVGSPLFPRYAAKSAALFFALVAVVFTLGALVQINPVWLWGPYVPWEALNPAQPDWYVGWLDGALRLGPPVSVHLAGHTIPSPFWQGVLLPGLLFALFAAWPWLEAALRGDRSAHNLLERPRDVPLRTATGVAMAVFLGGLTLAGSGDVQARYLHDSIAAITQWYRLFCLLGPLAAFAITYAVASELRRLQGVRAAQRVRLRRNEAGGIDPEGVA